MSLIVHFWISTFQDGYVMTTQKKQLQYWFLMVWCDFFVQLIDFETTRDNKKGKIESHNHYNRARDELESDQLNC